MAVTRQVVVVGAGIVGASVAFHLARHGLGVTVLDRTQPGSGATGSSFAWIGDDGDNHTGAAAALHNGASRDWHRLEADLPGVRVRWSGSLSWTRGQSEDLPRGRSLERAAVLSRAEVSALEPNLRRPPERAIYFSGDGAIDPVAGTQAILRAACDHGAQVLQATAIALRQRAGRLTGLETSGGFLPADDVVVAAGVGVPALCASLGVDLTIRSSPALLARYRTRYPLVRTLLAAPEAELRCAADGTLLAALPYQDQGTQEELDETGLRTLGWIKSAFRDTDLLTLTSVNVGVRPIPTDGVPIAGRLAPLQEVHVIVLHPGVQLAPIVGRLVAEEIVYGLDTMELRECRPERFMATGDLSSR